MNKDLQLATLCCFNLFLSCHFIKVCIGVWHWNNICFVYHYGVFLSRYLQYFHWYYNQEKTYQDRHKSPQTMKKLFSMICQANPLSFPKNGPRYWPFVRGIHRSPMSSPHKGQWRRALMFCLICAWIHLLSKHSWGWWFETQPRPFVTVMKWQGGSKPSSKCTGLCTFYMFFLEFTAPQSVTILLFKCVSNSTSVFVCFWYEHHYSFCVLGVAVQMKTTQLKQLSPHQLLQELCS